MIRNAWREYSRICVVNARPLTADGISFEIRQLAILSGLDQNQPISDSVRRGQRRKKIPSVHGFRKCAITQMARAKVNTETAKILTGHSIGVRDAYLKYSEEDLLSEYLKAVDNLTINEEHRLKTKVAELTIKNQSNEYIIKTKLEQKDQEINALKHQLMPILKKQKEIDLFLKDLEKDPVMAGGRWKRVVSDEDINPQE